MFAKFANFFIQNSKLTIVLIVITILAWIWSYIIIPKQYNPTIVVPAFSITVEAPSLENDEVKRLITDELENKIMELEWIDETYWISWDNYAWVMVKFKVWIDKEKAKIRLNQKLSQNMDLAPMWIKNPVIKAIDPEELAQITYAIYYFWKELDKNKQNIYLRQIANIIKNEIKTVKNVSTIEIVWWSKNNIIIELDLKKIEAKNTDIMQVYNILKKDNLSLPAWNINLSSWERIFLQTNWKIDDIKKLKKIVISKIWESTLYLWDIAEIKYGEKRNDKYSIYSDKIWNYNWVFLWIWKQFGTNWVFVVEDIKEKMNDIIKTLPKDIKVEIIQDEWENANSATSHLIKDLIESIIIVVILLIIFLGFKDALNMAVSIPLVLLLVFLYSYILWYNINRISLFALILVIWMVVDNSIIVVENIHRHLHDRVNNWKTKLQAILEGTQEVWVWVVMSTITKVFAFARMFAVSGMMWEYMGPIPKFAIAALLISIVVAFAINPWISYITEKDAKEDDKKHKIKKKSRFDVRILYIKIMEFFINSKSNYNKRRKIFKIVFWLSLILVIVWPIYAWIFKARMLPKSNQDQVYLWVDSARWTTAEKMFEIEKDINNFFFKNSALPKQLQITSSVSSTIWTPFVWDFANLFRWWNARMQEFQISSRINLISKDNNKDRLKSEIFAIKIRPYLREALLKKYPDLTIRLLEDPPGPPVRATFMMKIKTDSNDIDRDDFTKKVYNEVVKISRKQDLVDYGTSLSTTYRKININLDHESVSRAWLTIEQVAYTLAIAKNYIPISLIKSSTSLEPTSIIVWVNNEESENIELLKNISFTNTSWQKIFLWSIAKIEYSFVSPEINTDLRKETNYIYAEMWDNSVIYPVIELYSILQSDKFLWNDYKFLWWDFYGLHYEWIKDGKKYDIEWDWEWKLTMDTFRDLWTAMILAILAIYFLIVWQFRSFAVAWVIMLPFLLWFFWVFPGFSILYLLKNEYFNATAMIGIISLAWIVVWNAILLIDYVNILKKRWRTIEKALIEAWYIRFMPIMLTSLAAILGAIKIAWDPVWSWLARSIVWWLSTSAILTLIAVPIFYYDSQKKVWDKDMKKDRI